MPPPQATAAAGAEGPPLKLPQPTEEVKARQVPHVSTWRRIYTMRGLFRGTPRMPIPSTLDGHLYVPAGAAGIAMANLAARMGMETTGITLPLATPVDAAVAREIRTKSVVPESSEVGQEASAQAEGRESVGTGDSARPRRIAGGR